MWIKLEKTCLAACVECLRSHSVGLAPKLGMSMNRYVTVKFRPFVVLSVNLSPPGLTSVRRTDFYISVDPFKLHHTGVMRLFQLCVKERKGFI